LHYQILQPPPQGYKHNHNNMKASKMLKKWGVTYTFTPINHEELKAAIKADAVILPRAKYFLSIQRGNRKISNFVYLKTGECEVAKSAFCAEEMPTPNLDRLFLVLNISCVGTFENFCYLHKLSTDSITAKEIYDETLKLSICMERIFNPKEMEILETAAIWQKQEF
jgi:hypothetical protein